MATEQPRDDEGKFAPEGGAGESQMVTVTVDGKTEQVTLAEAAKGYQRQASYTKRQQDLQAEKTAFYAEREAARAAGLSGGLGGLQPPSGQQVFPGVGQQHGAAFGGGYEQLPGTTGQNASAPLPNLEDGEYASTEQLKAFYAAVQAREQVTAQQLQTVSQQQQELIKANMEQTQMADLRSRLPEFNEADLQDEILTLPKAEQDRFYALPKPIALETAYWRFRGAAGSAEPEKTPGKAGEETPAKKQGKELPFAEGERREPPAGKTTPAPITAPLSRDRTVMTETYRAVKDQIPVLGKDE